MPTRHPSGDSMEAAGYITVVTDSVKKKKKTQKYHVNYFLNTSPTRIQFC